MDRAVTIFQEVHDRLLAAYGPQGWWPGDSAFEIMLGAVLTQNTSWKNAERAIEQLRQHNALNLAAVNAMRTVELAELIRPAGYYRLKAKRVKNLVAHIFANYHGSLELMFAAGAASLRESLLSVNGVGPETADSIVLYAARKPVFVIDAYTARVFKRHGWIEFEADYHEMQARFHDACDQDEKLYNEYHALLVRVGKQHCGKIPKCEACPLEDLLPATGPLTPEF